MLLLFLAIFAIKPPLCKFFSESPDFDPMLPIFRVNVGKTPYLGSNKVGQSVNIFSNFTTLGRV